MADTDERSHQDVAALRSARARAQQGVVRLIDSYAEGFITKEEFTPGVERLRRRLADLDAQLAEQQSTKDRAADLQHVVGRLEEFAGRVRAGLHDADQPTKREILLAVVKRIEIDVQVVRVVFNVAAPMGGPPGQILRDCPSRAGTASVQVTGPYAAVLGGVRPDSSALLSGPSSAHRTHVPRDPGGALRWLRRTDGCSSLIAGALLLEKPRGSPCFLLFIRYRNSTCRKRP